MGVLSLRSSRRAGGAVSNPDMCFLPGQRHLPHGRAPGIAGEWEGSTGCVVSSMLRKLEKGLTMGTSECWRKHKRFQGLEGPSGLVSMAILLNLLLAQGLGGQNLFL